MIGYTLIPNFIGDLSFKEIPGAQGPTTVEGSLDTLVRKFQGLAKYFDAWRPQIGTPDNVYNQMFVTEVTPGVQEGSLMTVSVTYKGAAFGIDSIPVKINDGTTIKSSTVNADYVYTQRGVNEYGGTSIGSIPTGIVYNTTQSYYTQWMKLPVSVQVSYYAPSTNYKYVSRFRPNSPIYGPEKSDTYNDTTGVHGAIRDLTFFNISTSGNIKVPVMYDRINGGNDARAKDNITFQRIDLSNNSKESVCSSFTAQKVGIWWEVSETWEVELKPVVGSPITKDPTATVANSTANANTILTAGNLNDQPPAIQL